VQGTADGDLPPSQSYYAARAIPGAELLSLDAGTHLAIYTTPTPPQLKPTSSSSSSREPGDDPPSMCGPTSPFGRTTARQVSLAIAQPCRP
jgi:hypothetical protein